MSLFSLSLSRHTALRRPAPSLARWISAAIAARRSRRQLSNLQAHLLDDIGVSRNAAENEAKRPIWDVPSHWIQ